MSQREDQIVSVLASLLKRPRESFPVDSAWASLGVDSLTALRLAGRLSELMAEEVDPMLLLDCSCVRELAECLEQMAGAKRP